MIRPFSSSSIPASFRTTHGAIGSMFVWPSCTFVTTDSMRHCVAFVQEFTRSPFEMSSGYPPAQVAIERYPPLMTNQAPLLIQRAQSLAPLLAEHAAEAERLRKPHDAVIAALEESGIFKLMVPRSLGGFELDLDTFLEVGLALSEGDASMAWVSTFYIEHCWMFCHFPPAFQKEVFGDRGYALAPAAIAPTRTFRAIHCSGRYGTSAHCRATRSLISTRGSRISARRCWDWSRTRPSDDSAALPQSNFGNGPLGSRGMMPSLKGTASRIDTI